MSTFVALLRSINVGGRNRVLMGDLVGLVESLGFEDVETYVQSGNVVFTGRGAPKSTARAIEGAITDQLGLEVPVIVRSGQQLSRLLEVNPFLRSGADPKYLHVTLLAGPPAADRRPLLARSEGRSGVDHPYGDDEFELVGSDVFVHCPGGYGTTKLNNAFFERRAGVVATTRNWRTVTTLARMAGLSVPDPEGP
jgi:uncharacterized protein (DUF1697 family)